MKAIPFLFIGLILLSTGCDKSNHTEDKPPERVFVVKSDSASLMVRREVAQMIEGRDIGRGIHNDYEEWVELGYQKLGYIEGVLTNSNFLQWEGTFSSGVDAVNKFYRDTDNRIIPIPAALYIMNQKLNHGLSEEDFIARVSEFRKAAHEQAAQEEGAK